MDHVTRATLLSGMVVLSHRSNLKICGAMFTPRYKNRGQYLWRRIQILSSHIVSLFRSLKIAAEAVSLIAVVNFTKLENWIQRYRD